MEFFLWCPTQDAGGPDTVGYLLRSYRWASGGLFLPANASWTEVNFMFHLINITSTATRLEPSTVKSPCNGLSL